MKTFRAFVLAVIASMLVHQTVSAHNNRVPFTATQPPFFSTDSRILTFNSSLKKDRILLSWSVDANQDADRFEVEKSVDGKTFTMAAVVFGTDKTGTGSYQFLETEKYSKTYYYRIRIISKNKSEEFSQAIMAGPGAIK
ncbi:MAG TPA: hypothetical protein VE933_03015 [Chitinophagaceae bacterium]|nr:hypothetical protein [Chitinophagaceae bacterium]